MLSSNELEFYKECTYIKDTDYQDLIEKLETLRSENHNSQYDYIFLELSTSKCRDLREHISNILEIYPLLSTCNNNHFNE